MRPILGVGLSLVVLGISVCGIHLLTARRAGITTAPAPEEKSAMPNTSTLILRYLQEVFGESDPTRRRAAIDELLTEDCVFYDPMKNVYQGREAIDRIAGKIRATHPDFRYQPLGPPEESGNGGRIRWVEGRPGAPPEVAGTDFIIVRDGRVAAIYFFFDELPRARQGKD